MRAGSVLIVVVLFSALLAGCASKSSDAGTDAGSTAQVGALTTTSHGPTGKAPGTTGPSATSAAPDSSGPASGVNHAPSATIAADIQKGSFPLPVNFTLTGKDPDGDAMTYTFDADGDGKTDKEGKSTEFPAKVAFTYSAAGNYTATLKVSDGKNTTTVKTVIDVTAAAAGKGPAQVEDGSYQAGAPEGCIPAASGAASANVAADYAKVDIKKETIGKPFTAKFTATGPFVWVRVQYWADSSTVVATHETMNGDTVSGTVDKTSTFAIFTSCGGASVSFHYEA